MKIRLLVGSSLLALLIASSAYGYSYLAFEQVTVAASSIGFTIAKICPDSQSTAFCGPGGRIATIATCTLETANVNFTIDRTTPTSSVGMLWTSGTTLTFNGADVLQNFRAIRTTGSSGQLDCTYAAQ